MPHIKRYPPGVLFGCIQTEPFWMCSDDLAIGTGETPKEAYDDWMKYCPKSRISRMNLKFWSWIF